MPHGAEWTVATLHEHFVSLLEEMDKRNEQRFAAQEKAVDAALSSAKEAVLKAEHSAEERFRNTNEWRQTVESLISGCFPKDEANRVIRTLEEKITTNTAMVTAIAGERRGLHSGWGYAVGFIGLLAAVFFGMQHR